MKSPVERAARNLCSLDGHPADIKFEGRPMWQSYLPVVDAVLRGISEPDDEMLGAGKQLLAVKHGHTVDEYEVGLTWAALIDVLRSDVAQSSPERLDRTTSPKR